MPLSLSTALLGQVVAGYEGPRCTRCCYVERHGQLPQLLERSGGHRHSQTWEVAGQRSAGLDNSLAGGVDQRGSERGQCSQAGRELLALLLEVWVRFDLAGLGGVRRG